MKCRLVAAALLRVAIAVVAALGIDGNSRTRGQSAQPQVNQPSRQGSATVLAAIRAAELAAALAREERAKNGDKYVSVSFPFPTCVFEGGLCGALNRDGSIAVAPEFDWVDKFHEGRALVRLGGLYGYVDTEGRRLVEPRYEIAGAYWRGFAEVSIGGKSALIDLAGRVVLEPRFARAHPFSADVFWVKDGTRRYDGRPGLADLVDYETLIAVNDVAADGKWGLIDRAGTWTRAPEFTVIGVFDRNDSSLMRAKTDAGWGVIRPDGTWFIEPRFESLSELSDGLAIASLGGRFGYVDRTGAVVLEPKFDNLSYIGTDELASAKVGKLWGLIDRAGAWVIEPRYDLVVHGLAHYQGAIWVRVGEKWGAIDRVGQLIVSPQFSQPGGTICGDGWIIGNVDRKRRAVRREGAALATPEGQLFGSDCERPLQVQVGDKLGYVDRMARPITEVKFESASDFFQDIAIVKLDSRFGYLKRDGSWLIEPRFEQADPFGGDFAAVKLGGKFGCVKRDGTWLVEPQLPDAPFDCAQLVSKIDGKFGHRKPDGTWQIDPSFGKVTSFGGGFDAVKIGGKFGVVDNTGAWLIEPRWQSFGIALQNGLVAAKFEEKWGFIDAGGASVIDDRYDEFSYFERGISWVKTGDMWCAIDRRGRDVPTVPCQATNPHPRAGASISSRIGSLR